jgi:hypothetical protein
MASYDLYWNDDDRKLVQLTPAPKDDFVDLGEELKQFWKEWDNRYCYDDSDDDDSYDDDEYCDADEYQERDESFWDYNYCLNVSYSSTDLRLNSMSSDDFSTDDGQSSDGDSDCSDDRYRFYHDKTEKNYFYI